MSEIPEADSQISGSESRSGRDAERLRREVAEGLFYTHFRLIQSTNKTLENSAFLYGLIELLDEKNLISVQELDERKKVVAEG